MQSQDIKIGLGCGVGDGIKKDVLIKALQSGIRYFDTASLYSLGAITEFDRILEDLSIDRKDVHLSVKLWITDLGPNRYHDWDAHYVSLRSVHDELLRKFNVSHFDSLVIHWPLKVDETGLPDEFRLEEVWPQLEELVLAGCVSHIGVSNFNILQMHRLLANARIVPFTAQIEFNPFANNMALVEFCHKHGIHVVGHSPFHFGWMNGQLELFSNPVIKEISEKHNKPAAQIVLSWIMRHKVIPIPGTTKVEHIDDYIQACDDGYLDDGDMQAINSLNAERFNYLNILDHFNHQHHKKYYGDKSDLTAMIYTNKIYEKFRQVSLYDPSFLEEAKKALTSGPGFIILPGFLKNEVRALKDVIAKSGLTSASRWTGGGGQLENIINSGREILEITDDPLLALIVESLLGWDCKLDNIALSTSKTAPDNAIFGPHQDSPFDINPGAPLPPPSYPMILQCIVALDEYNEDNGPLYVIPDSHKKRQRVTLPWQGNLQPEVIPAGALKAICPEGSVVLAVGHIWHGTYANMTDKERKGLLVEFSLSVCEPAHKFTSGAISDDLINNCSKRVVRLLGYGKLHAIGASINDAFKAVHEVKIPAFAIKS
ncbi:MAG: aldo/keto reductase [Asticcacaulis sp.]